MSEFMGVTGSMIRLFHLEDVLKRAVKIVKKED